MKRVFYLICYVTLLAGCRSDSTKLHVWGIDVSRHQSGVDWHSVKKHNEPHFVFLKATEGTMISDPTYKKHAKELNEKGITWGAYHFFGHRTCGKDQANFFIKTAGLRVGNLIPVLDIEYHRFMKDPKKSVKEAKKFCKVIKSKYGVNPIIYTATNFYERYLKDDFSHKDYILWIADYRGEPKDIEWSIWQHTDSHDLKGIKSRVDRNVFRGKDIRDIILR